MKRTDFALVIIATVALLATSQMWAAVKVEPEGPAESNVETPVAGRKQGSARGGPAKGRSRSGRSPTSSSRRVPAMPSI